jgi:hypothetical protein
VAIQLFTLRRRENGALIITKGGPPREAKMVLVPVVLVIGGILGLVCWLEKRASPWPK